jgi:hypothetical protein
VDAKPQVAMVPMDVPWEGAWLSWVAATTACLRALGVECDLVDVAGMSGYAFTLNVHQTVDVSSPTAFDWAWLTEGVRLLGRSTMEFHHFDMGGGTDPTGELRLAGCQAAYDMVAREIAEGRPCVIWGAYDPDFAAAVGVEDGFYHVKSFKEDMGQPQPPIKWDELLNPSGSYALAFPTATKATQMRRDAYAAGHAVQLLMGRQPVAEYALGLSAYDMWIAALEGNKEVHDYGNSYSAQCFAEGRRFASGFVQRLAKRNPECADPLGRAVVAYGEASGAMNELAQVFTHPPKDELEDPAKRAKGVELLKAAKLAETRAAGALLEAQRWWTGKLLEREGE